MSLELTNLLPPDRARAWKNEYYLRLGTLACIALIIIAVAHAALLVPSYLFVQERVSLEREHLAELDAALTSSGEGEMNTRLLALETDAKRIEALAGAPSASSVVRAVLAVPKQGISIIGLSFEAPKPSGRLSITGIAATRESLRRYALELSQLSFAEATDLPLSAYAKESEIPFTIVLTGPLTP